MAGLFGVTLTGCATPPSMPPASGVECRPGAVDTRIGGEAIMGAGSDGFVSDTDLVFSTVVTPGGTSNCTSVGATVPVRQEQRF